MTEFYIKVKPDSNEFRVEEGSFPEFYLESKAENGKANSELLSKLENILGQRPGIVSGHKSSRKKIKVDLSRDEVDRKLEAEING